MNEADILLVYKSLRLPVLVIAISYITYYVYKKRTKDEMEKPKYRMLEED
ncbi:cbb3-type cytochrome c oxidase subunit 3 [Leptospira kanakyensis]|uniref:Cbb3-type cytochrome c oxidase subunit 3 n=1 Tax=Leptospira kanakyensis TaxID=2484968 RepID=A0A6N4QJP1_9LEPT|nr:cbb3-type cytochrome c oxidase subunit 3 [Leptospira kanakyensis]MCW7470856.1 cbb3-type cytochrome c oxidase subunit 3 [Leptospira kanakyensis]MCW7482953.1 cbb3-type cytochrome c oxidase subunit 3 [Leptospira kanakyensis]TGK54461.1 cbb3-type cytochrome c oxidase subunit 3 [Leptospira kanakyensis]TGK59071.1 cbb3-type cytochrome c oxidase subunit 3 [Leptospira kanakyensis]TGK75222.1 cbb3-type cytochrome c oxidase subunit 3 [Leptospira kanakyensis]